MFPKIDLVGKVILEEGMVVASPKAGGPTMNTDPIDPIVDDSGPSVSEAVAKTDEDYGGPRGTIGPVHRCLRKVPA